MRLFVAEVLLAFPTLADTATVTVRYLDFQCRFSVAVRYPDSNLKEAENWDWMLTGFADCLMTVLSFKVG